jgi:O-succinylbenzoic acid--CoA ligase
LCGVYWKERIVPPTSKDQNWLKMDEGESMQNWLFARFKATPLGMALFFEGQVWNYAQLYAVSIRIAKRLADRGIGPGKRVAVLLESGPAYVGLIHACTLLGAVLVPLNTRLTAKELAWQVEFSQPSLLVHAGEGAALAGLAPALVDVADLLGGDREPGVDPTLPPFSPKEHRLDDTLAILFTSGTTGRPKGAMLSYGNFFHGANASAYRLGLHTDDCWLSCLPLYHVGGLAVIFRSCLYGTAIDLHRRFDPEVYWQTLAHNRVTLASLVPTMLHRLLESQGDRRWPDSLRVVLLGGAATQESLRSRGQAAGVPILTTYGLTEASSQVATQHPNPLWQKPGSVGKPLLFTQVRILGQEGQDLPPGQIGEVLVQGPQVMQGYFRNPEATAQALRDDWLHTGDMGYLDPDGDLFLVQRRRDIIVTGGENVYPAEVEEALRGYPGVVDACVVGVDDPEWGQRVAALIQTRQGQPVDAAALVNFLRQEIAGYKIPRQFAFTDQLPQTASGKIERRQVEALMQG